ncbi:MAG TPA: hypothetical protein EYP46_02985 [Hadesarchaea archaeon]|nr:hypothetical protein [Hadesarchaea archaeon]
MTRVVIIGHESAGFTAACSAKAADRRAEVTVIERRKHPLYHPCGMPFAIGEEIDLKNLIENTRAPNVNLRLGTEAKSIDLTARIVEVTELKSGKTETISYDSLILATGGCPSRPPIPGVDLGGVHVLRTIEDAEAIIEAAKKAKRAVVVGGGTIGVETSAALKRRGLETLLVELMPHVLPTILDQDMAELVVERLQKEEVHVLCSQQLGEIKGKEKVKSVVVGGEEHPADLVVMATGVKPEVKLAEEAGLTLGVTGGIKVDQYLRTNDPYVFAAGDCVETKNLITGKPSLSPLAPIAIKMGRTAGENAVGGKSTFEGISNTVVTSVHELVIASAGVTTEKAEEAGMEVVSSRIRTLNKPSYLPGAKPIYIKLIVEIKERRLVGGQIISTNGVAERVNLLSFVIQKGMRVEELADMEYCYMPALSNTIEPLTIAAEAVLRKL